MSAIELEQLATLILDVAAMRRAQKDYFRTRSPEALRASKAAEAKVDRQVADFVKYAAQKANGQRQTTLGDIA
jgi:hypothetical protein